MKRRLMRQIVLFAALAFTTAQACDGLLAAGELSPGELTCSVVSNLPFGGPLSGAKIVNYASDFSSYQSILGSARRSRNYYGTSRPFGAAGGMAGGVSAKFTPW